ncbi:hypothetical protein ACJD0Z_07640 [Flavobacteriaceae bacterium M23B6Z8]
MNYHYIFTSLTRISDLSENPFQIKKIPTSQWETGDYVTGQITDPGSNKLSIELPNGRMRGVIGGEHIIGALGERYATLEATGSWRAVGKNLKMHILTGAGLLGKLTSKSAFVPQMIEIDYIGHVVRKQQKITMDTFVFYTDPMPFKTPVILFTGTSMSAGKTTSARIVTNILKGAGLKVVGAKLTGAGRLKDILAMKDVGADSVIDFVDVGLPSSIYPSNAYRKKLKELLTRIEMQKPDIAVVEIGASPLEPYNGDIAIEEIRDQIKCLILSASDPYAVYGLMQAYDIIPDIVTGIATNTLAGSNLVEKLCGVKALNLIDASTTPELRRIITSKIGFQI